MPEKSIIINNSCCRYEQIYHMSGRAAQDQDAIRRIKLEAEIATRKLTQRDRHRGIKGPMNIEFAPQTIMRVRSWCCVLS
jgi:hypothetical protein